MSNKNWKLLLVGALIGLAAAARLIDHVPNVAPIAAIALLAGARWRWPWSLLVPMAAMLISDMVIGFAVWPIAVAVYVSFALMVGLGAVWLRRNQSPWRVLPAAILASSLFFLITNAAVWWFSGMYERTLDGLLLSYFMGVPFYRMTMLGDMVYTYGLFLAVKYAPSLVAGIERRLRLKFQISPLRRD